MTAPDGVDRRRIDRRQPPFDHRIPGGTSPTGMPAIEPLASAVERPSETRWDRAMGLVALSYAAALTVWFTRADSRRLDGLLLPLVVPMLVAMFAAGNDLARQPRSHARSWLPPLLAAHDARGGAGPLRTARTPSPRAWRALAATSPAGQALPWRRRS
ncbi:MAG: hypothetical protein HEQ38_19025 [Gemmatimonas sp.]|nr:hypothetical protein [Gemmatimonas sp.]